MKENIQNLEFRVESVVSLINQISGMLVIL